MKFTVKCNQCSHTFVAETQTYGRMKYRCPYCGAVLTCQFDPPQQHQLPQDSPNKFYVRARSVVPVGNTQLIEQQQELPTVSTHLLHMPSKEDIQEVKEAVVHQYKQRKEGFMGMVSWIWGHLSVFALTSSKKIRKFQDDYEDGDLWVFFAFSFLFIVLVILGLLLVANVVNLVAEGHSWIFKNWIAFKNSMDSFL